MVGSEEQRLVATRPIRHRPGRLCVHCCSDGRHITSEQGSCGNFGRTSPRSMVRRHGRRQRHRRCFGTGRSRSRTTDPPSPGYRMTRRREEVASPTSYNCVRCRNTRRSKHQRSNGKVTLFSFPTTAKIMGMILIQKTLHVDDACRRKRRFLKRVRRSHSRKELTTVAFLRTTPCHHLRIHSRSNHFWTRTMTKCLPGSFKSSSTSRQHSFFILMLQL